MSEVLYDMRLCICAKSRYACVCVSYLCLWMRPKNSLYNSIKHQTTAQHFICVDMLKRKSISCTCKRITFIFINLSSEHIHTCVHVQNTSLVWVGSSFRLTLLIWDYCGCCCCCCYTVSSIQISLFVHAHTSVCWIFRVWSCVCVRFVLIYYYVLFYIMMVIHNCTHFWSYHIHCVCCSSVFLSMAHFYDDEIIFGTSATFSGYIIIIGIGKFRNEKRREANNERIPMPFHGRTEWEREREQRELTVIHVFNFIGIFGSFTYQHTNKNENHWHSVVVWWCGDWHCRSFYLSNDFHNQNVPVATAVAGAISKAILLSLLFFSLQLCTLFGVCAPFFPGGF